MCGRFEQGADFGDVMSEFDVSYFEGGIKYEELKKEDIRPTNDVSVVYFKQQNHIMPMRWQLVPRWSKELTSKYPMFNARSETLTEKPSFKQLVKSNRCILPATAFFEWKEVAGQKKKTKYRINVPSKKVFGLAGLYDTWDDKKGTLIYSCTIITLDANDFMKNLHDRMPLILNKEDYATWLSSDFDHAKNLIKQYSSQDMHAEIAS